MPLWRSVDVMTLHTCSSDNQSVNKCLFQHQGFPICQSDERSVSFQPVCCVICMQRGVWEESAFCIFCLAVFLCFFLPWVMPFMCKLFLILIRSLLILMKPIVFHHLWTYRQNILPNITHSLTSILIFKFLKNIYVDLIQQDISHNLLSFS